MCDFGVVTFAKTILTLLRLFYLVPRQAGIEQSFLKFRSYQSRNTKNQKYDRFWGQIRFQLFCFVSMCENLSYAKCATGAPGNFPLWSHFESKQLEAQRIQRLNSKFISVRIRNTDHVPRVR